MGDLVIFVAVVGLMVALGVAMGMIVAGRIDRIMAPPPKKTGREAGAAAPAGAAPEMEDHQP